MIWLTNNIAAREWCNEAMEQWIAASHQGGHFGLPEPQELSSLPQPPVILGDPQMLQYEAAPHWAPSPPQPSQWHSQGIGTVPEGIGMGICPSNK